MKFTKRGRIFHRIVKLNDVMEIAYQKRLKVRKVCAWILGTILVPIVLSFFF